jgi:Bifunctional DNA primase/polymerase, N-terminal
MRALDAALELSARGLYCFPCADSKRPTCPNGFKDAAADPEQLRTLWAAHPGTLIGVPTGDVSGITVLDIDPKHLEALAWWAENRERLPTTRVHRTRSSGLHLLFQHVPGIKCSAGKLARGIDIRNDGGYVVWWPGSGYPVLHDGPIAGMPLWLSRRLLPPPHRPKVPISIHNDQRALRGLIRVVATARQGERNQITYWAACRAGEMVVAGKLSESDAVALLVEAASRTGLCRDEALRTVRSGLRAVRR